MANLPQTARMHLRPIREDDLAALVELDSDPEVMRYLTDGEPWPEDVIRDVALPKMLAPIESFPGAGYFAAESYVEREFLGWFHLRPPADDPSILEVGFRLRRATWGKGLATEGATALVAWGFESLEAPYIFGKTMAANMGSRRVLQKAGLVFEGAFIEEKFPGADQRGVRFGAVRAGWLDWHRSQTGGST